MLELLPAILVADALEFKEKLGILDGHAPVVQIDIMDGHFVAQTTFADPAETARHNLKYELHLMVEDPIAELLKWKEVSGVVRVIVHAEIEKPLAPIIIYIKGRALEVGIAINPETSWEKIDALIPELDTVLVMTVHPGAAGQPFEDAVSHYHLLSKIYELHEAHPTLVISVDGGVSEKTAPFLIEAGATRFVVGSAMWKAKNPVEVLEKLEKIIQSHHNVSF